MASLSTTSSRSVKCFISKPLAKKAKPEELAKPAEQEAPTEDFPETTGCLIIFSGAKAYGDKCRLKAAQREVHAVEPIVPQYLRWSEFHIVFNHRDHPDRIPHPRTYPLIVKSIMGSKCVSKVLMDVY
jgi:hypothetical protein